MAPDRLTELVSHAGPALAEVPVAFNPWVQQHAGERFEELANLLRMRNGFLAFDRALRVFPAVLQDHPLSLGCWNSSDLWRDSYGALAENLVFFADDLFGGQFCIKEDRIFTFDPETAELEHIADNLEGWAARILDDPGYLTGQRLAQEWRAAFGSIDPTLRLLPKLPFTVGGQFELANLYVSDAVAGMRFRGELAQKLKDLPDGTKIRFVLTDEPV